MTAQQKLKVVADSLGLATFTQMQGTTRNIYHEIANPAAANASLTFFRNVGQAAEFRRNINENKFQVNEGLLVESISIYAVQSAGDISPITGMAIGELTIGNQTVLKDVPLSTIISQGNTAKGAENAVFYMAPLVGIVIPPQVEFSLRVNFELSQGTAEDVPYIGAQFYGTGVLLNLKNSL
jgi:hypothetical protein